MAGYQPLNFPFIHSSDIVGFTRNSLLKGSVQSFAVVLDIKPVTYLAPVTIDRQGALLNAVADDEWNQFFRKLVWAVIVGAVGHDGIHAIGMVPCPHEMITGGFGGRIG